MRDLIARRDNANTVLEIPSQDIARHAASAFKVAQKLDDDEANDKRKAFREWLDQGAVHAGKGTAKLPGRAAFQYIRTSHGWAPAAKGIDSMNKWQKETVDEDDPEDWETARCDDTEPTLLHHQAEVELAADGWAELWQEGHDVFTPTDGSIPSNLPPRQAESIRAAAETLPHGTGLGADNMSPTCSGGPPHPPTTKASRDTQYVRKHWSVARTMATGYHRPPTQT